MANSKSEQHIINLANPDLNRERLKGEIKPWDGFNDRNSPYLSGECLPLYTKTISGSNQWISPSLDAYSMYYDGRLMKNGVPFGPTMKSAFVKTALHPPENYPDILAGTPNCYICGKQGQDGIRLIFGSGTVYDQPITYGTGFDWENCINYLGISYNVISSRSWVGVCWGGKCYVYSNGTLYTSPYVLGTSSQISGNMNVCIANVGNKLYFGCTHGSSIISFDTTDQTWANLTSITWQTHTGTTLFDSGTVSASNICMDQLGGCSVFIKGNTHSSRYGCAYAGYAPLHDYMRFFIQVTVQSTRYYGNAQFLGDNTLELDYPTSVEVWPDTYQSDIYGEVPLVTQPGMRDYYGDVIDYHTCDYVEDPLLASPIETHSRYGIFETKTAFKSSREEDGILYNVQFVSSSFPEGMVTLPHATNQYPWGAAREAVQWTYRYNDYVRVLFNSGVMVNVSMSEQTNTRGNIIMPWGSIQDFWCDYNSMMIKDQNGNFIAFSSSPASYTQYSVFRDRYILLWTSSYWNAYDTQEDVWLHYADDWNNRFNSDGWRIDDSEWTMLASGSNSQYLITHYPFPGAEFDKAMHRYTGAFTDTFYLMKGNYIVPSGFSTKENGVDVYWTGVGITEDIEDSTIEFTPEYFRTWMNRWVVRDYGGNVVWRTDNSIFNIPLMTTFQTDLYTLFVLPDTTSALALQQQGGEYLIYYAGTNNNNFSRICCVQSMFYGVTNDGVYSMEIIDSAISNTKKIADISRLTYVSYTPMCIYFWSKANRNTYLFTGDATLKPITGCSEFTRVSKCKYKPDTLETFMMTDKGIYVSAAEYCYKVPIAGIQATDIFFTNDGFAVKGLYECKCFTYYPKEGYSTLVPMVLETMLYGAGNNVVSTTDCIYLRFYRGDIGNTTANVKISGHTLTDFSTELQDNTGKTYAITKDDWDATTNTYYLRYQPTYQKGLGISIRVESDVPLIYMGFGATPETLQITK